MVEDLGGKYEILPQWDDLFLRKGPGDPRKPSLNKEQYPSKIILLQELERQHHKVVQLLSTMELSKLNEKFKWRFSKYMPTLYDLIVFMCINHEAMHLGQLSAWRRSMGFNSALAKL